jgi:hypothetical protein
MIFEKNAKTGELAFSKGFLLMVHIKELRCLQRFFLKGNVAFLLPFLIDLLIVYPTVKKKFNLRKKFPEKTYFFITKFFKVIRKTKKKISAEIFFSCLGPEFGKLQISKSFRNTCIAGLVRLKVGISSCHRFWLAFVIRILSNVNVCSVDGSLKMFFYL